MSPHHWCQCMPKKMLPPHFNYIRQLQCEEKDEEGEKEEEAVNPDCGCR